MIQYRANNKFSKMSGDTIRLNKEILENVFGGRYGRIKDTMSKKATRTLHQKISFPKNPNFFKCLVID